MKEQINEEFDKLHQFLRDEKETMTKKLDLEARQKTASLENKIEIIKQELHSLSDTIRDIKVELQSEDIKFLKVRVPFILSHFLSLFFSPYLPPFFLLPSVTLSLSTCGSAWNWARLVKLFLQVKVGSFKLSATMETIVRICVGSG